MGRYSKTFARAMYAVEIWSTGLILGNNFMNSVGIVWWILGQA